MIEWIKWRLGIGWFRHMQWLCSGVTRRIEDGVEVVREDFWFNRKTLKVRVVRFTRPLPKHFDSGPDA